MGWDGVFTRIEHFALRVENRRGSKKRPYGQGGQEKCEKMRFEATKLLKIKEVDLERTQLRTQFWGCFGATMRSFGRLLAAPIL